MYMLYKINKKQDPGASLVCMMASCTTACVNNCAAGCATGCTGDCAGSCYGSCETAVNWK